MRPLRNFRSLFLGDAGVTEKHKQSKRHLGFVIPEPGEDCSLRMASRKEVKQVDLLFFLILLGLLLIFVFIKRIASLSFISASLATCILATAFILMTAIVLWKTHNSLVV